MEMDKRYLEAYQLYESSGEMTFEKVGEQLGVSRTTAQRWHAFARRHLGTTEDTDAPRIEFTWLDFEAAVQKMRTHVERGFLTSGSALLATSPDAQFLASALHVQTKIPMLINRPQAIIPQQALRTDGKRGVDNVLYVGARMREDSDMIRLGELLRVLGVFVYPLVWVMQADFTLDQKRGDGIRARTAYIMRASTAQEIIFPWEQG